MLRLRALLTTGNITYVCFNSGTFPKTTCFYVIVTPYSTNNVFLFAIFAIDISNVGCTTFLRVFALHVATTQIVLVLHLSLSLFLNDLRSISSALSKCLFREHVLATLCQLFNM